MAKQGVITLSTSKAGPYIICPHQSFLHAQPEIPKKTDYPRLMGSAVHQLVQKMYKPSKNPLYYSTLQKAQGAWWWKWKTALEQKTPVMRERSKEWDEEFGVSGLCCITNYWKDNVDKPRPKEVEKRFRVKMFPKVWFIGIFDQIRTVPLEGIEKIRPDLIVNGKLKDGYDPVLLVDLKTNKESYDPRRYRPNITNDGMASYQFDLHENMQITAYYWLYYQVYKKLPVAFYWYHLRSGKAFRTYRTMGDFEPFLDTMRYVAEGFKNESYPLHFGKHCKFCDYNTECKERRPERPLMFTEPSDGIDLGGEMIVWPQVLSTGIKQLRLNFPSSKKGK